MEGCSGGVLGGQLWAFLGGFAGALRAFLGYSGLGGGAP